MEHRPAPSDACPELFQTARDLIALESITGNEEPVAAYLERALLAMGLAPRSQEVAPGRRNIVAGPERPSVLFATHMDTVPPYMPLGEDERYLHGRGACDTKGIIACMLEAARRLQGRGVHDFGCLFVVGEETDNAGAIVAGRLLRSRWVILGEPTENRVAIGHKGLLRLEVTVTGTACHSAYPDEGDSAIHRLLRGLTRVLETDFGTSSVLGPATVNVGEISGGVAANVLAPLARASIVVRVVGEVDDAYLAIRRAFDDPVTGEPDHRVELHESRRMAPPRLERVEGFPETIVSYGTDAPFLQDVGRVVLFGPGTIRDAHTAHERIEKSAMLEAASAYVDLALQLQARA
ncbi:MAG TPA: M20/M25/M40 family metallo-hydrolase [Planctomycetota bacterium]|nr:M20/M25/M40 family metallo-hydrolase [Planctomycetota bacterium]